MSVTTRARCDWSVQSPLQGGENRRRHSPSLLMVKEGGLLQKGKGEDNGGKFPRRCKKKGGYWMPKNEFNEQSFIIDFRALSIL